MCVQDTVFQVWNALFNANEPPTMAGIVPFHSWGNWGLRRNVIYPGLPSQGERVNFETKFWDQVHSPILSTTAHLAWVTGWFWVLPSIPFPPTPSCPNFGPHSQQEEADTFQKVFTSPSSNVPHTQPGSQQPSFGKQEMDCISSSLCLRWEAKVIFQLKSLPSLNGRTQYGFVFSLWCFPTWLEPHPHLSSRSTWSFCTYLALPSAFWPLLYFSLVGVSLGHTPLYLCGQLQTFCTLGTKCTFLNDFLKNTKTHYFLRGVGPNTQH